MAMTFYVNMQKRGDGKVYADLHKTDGKIYYDQIDAERDIDSDGLGQYRHVVEMVGMTAAEFDEYMAEIENLRAELKGLKK